MEFVSKGELNTDLAQKIGGILERSAKHRYKAFNEAKKKAQKKNDGSTTGDHVDANAVPKGVLGKIKGYAQNGSNYLRSKNGRSVYRNFDHKYLEHVRDLVRKVAAFPGGPAENFDPSAKDSQGQPANQDWPYKWEAHHILPGSSFYYMMPQADPKAEKRPAFTYQQLRLILMSDYNINHGHNIIMLPKQGWAVPVHALIQHPGDHPRYTQAVMEEFKNLSRKIQKKIDEQEDHKAIAANFFEELKDLEDHFWGYLVKLSQAAVAAMTEGQQYDHPHVRYAPEEGDSIYEWGSLF